MGCAGSTSGGDTTTPYRRNSGSANSSNNGSIAAAESSGENNHNKNSKRSEKKDGGDGPAQPPPAVLTPDDHYLGEAEANPARLLLPHNESTLPPLNRRETAEPRDLEKDLAAVNGGESGAHEETPTESEQETPRSADERQMMSGRGATDHSRSGSSSNTAGGGSPTAQRSRRRQKVQKLNPDILHPASRFLPRDLNTMFEQRYRGQYYDPKHPQYKILQPEERYKIVMEELKAAKEREVKKAEQQELERKQREEKRKALMEAQASPLADSEGDDGAMLTADLVSALPDAGGEIYGEDRKAEEIQRTVSGSSPRKASDDRVTINTPTVGGASTTADPTVLMTSSGHSHEDGGAGGGESGATNILGANTGHDGNDDGGEGEVGMLQTEQSFDLSEIKEDHLLLGGDGEESDDNGAVDFGDVDENFNESADFVSATVGTTSEASADEFIRGSSSNSSGIKPLNLKLYKAENSGGGSGVGQEDASTLLPPPGLPSSSTHRGGGASSSSPVTIIPPSSFKPKLLAQGMVWPHPKRMKDGTVVLFPLEAINDSMPISNTGKKPTYQQLKLFRANTRGALGNLNNVFKKHLIGHQTELLQKPSIHSHGVGKYPQMLAAANDAYRMAAQLGMMKYASVFCSMVAITKDCMVCVEETKPFLHAIKYSTGSHLLEEFRLWHEEVVAEEEKAAFAAAIAERRKSAAPSATASAYAESPLNSPAGRPAVLVLPTSGGVNNNDPSGVAIMTIPTAGAKPPPPPVRMSSDAEILQIIGPKIDTTAPAPRSAGGGLGSPQSECSDDPLILSGSASNLAAIARPPPPGNALAATMVPMDRPGSILGRSGTLDVMETFNPIERHKSMKLLNGRDNSTAMFDQDILEEAAEAAAAYQERQRREHTFTKSFDEDDWDGGDVELRSGAGSVATAAPLGSQGIRSPPPGAPLGSDGGQPGEELVGGLQILQAVPSSGRAQQPPATTTTDDQGVITTTISATTTATGGVRYRNPDISTAAYALNHNAEDFLEFLIFRFHEELLYCCLVLDDMLSWADLR